MPHASSSDGCLPLVQGTARGRHVVTGAPPLPGLSWVQRCVAADRLPAVHPEKLDDHLAPMYRLLDEYALDRAVPVEDDDVLARAGRTVDANWKTYLENASVNILHEGFTHETYRGSPDVPRVRGGERTFVTVPTGRCLAFGVPDERRAPHLCVWRRHPPHLGRSPSTPPSKGYFVTLYPNIAMPIRVRHVPARDLPARGTGPHPDSPLRQLPSGDAAAFRADTSPPTTAGSPSVYARVYDEDRIAIEAVQRRPKPPRLWRQHFYAAFWDELHYGLDNLRSPTTSHRRLADCGQRVIRTLLDPGDAARPVIARLCRLSEWKRHVCAWNR